MKPAPRLFTVEELSKGREFALAKEQRHYLVHVLRLKPGDPVALFNASDGEWRAFLRDAGKKHVSVRVEGKVSEARQPPDIDFLFAPLKHARLDYMVQKATELGARRLRPVITQRTVAERVNLERMKANAIEAAEQCNLIFVPEVADPEKLDRVLASWPRQRRLVFCDETAGLANPLAALEGVTPPAAVLIGPEGGFTEDERAMIKATSAAIAISLGPRIMRADTAAVAALTLIQAMAGDWHA
jgi:16S rRNA (uracil1498-N3)-methyltransferase